MSVRFADAARVVVYSRNGCHLCETAEAIVDEVCGALGVDWKRVDIDADPELKERFTFEVPVTYVDGQQHDMWQVDEARLRAAVASEG